MFRKLAYIWLVPILTLVPTCPARCEKDVNGVPVLTTIREYANPKHTAVVVVDMQNEIVSTEGGYWRKDRKAPANPKAHQVAPAYRDLVQNIRALVERARGQGIPVIYTEYIHRDANGKMVVNGPECWTHRNADWVSCAVAGTWEARTVRELAPRPGDLVIQKSRANTFYNTYLDDVLKEKSIRTVLLTGTAGGGCVFATAMGALERGYYAVFVKDCVDQTTYLESDLIRGRFPIHASKELQAAWDEPVGKKPGGEPKAAKRPAAAAGEKPNLVWIMADDLGYGDLGCYGQKVIQTPHLDRMAREGMRFTQFYAGATVCAPSRSVLMTGQHHGRTRVRGNAGRANPVAQALRGDDVTVARVLRDAGYTTALIGKWGLGDVGAAATGLPRKQGFDSFFGYLNQTHAHNHFPAFLWRNEEKVPLPNEVTPVGDAGGGYATRAVAYADDLFADEARRFVAANRARPFFLYWSMVTPHANNERTRAVKDGAHVPDYGPYAGRDWPAPDKGQAAMITRLDAHVGRFLEHLKKLGIAERTLVIFTSDNGPHSESNHNLARFRPSGPLTGIKRSLTDGGIRVPMIAWRPGTVPAGKESAHAGYFGDWMATAAELAGAKLPPRRDSISFVPTLLGRADQPRHEFLYWEFHERGFSQAALYRGRWKGIRERTPDAPLALYDLHNDIAEKTDVAAKYPEVVAKLNAYLNTARSDSPDWPIGAVPAPAKKPKR